MNKIINVTNDGHDSYPEDGKTNYAFFFLLWPSYRNFSHGLRIMFFILFYFFWFLTMLFTSLARTRNETKNYTGKKSSTTRSYGLEINIFIHNIIRTQTDTKNIVPRKILILLNVSPVGDSVFFYYYYY